MRALQRINFMRVIRFVFGIWLVSESIATRSFFPLILGGILLYQAFFNKGCGGNQCTIN